MELSMEILEGEKLCRDLDEIENQLAAVWKDPTAAMFLDKFRETCTAFSDSVKKLRELS